jgi:dTDP-glucose pyrophosphorylase
MPEELIGLIPAAGKGVRLNLPYPKELYPIIRNNRYKPLSQFVLDSILLAGVKHVVFVINDTKHLLMGYYGSGQRFNCSISYVVQEIAENNTASTSPGLAAALDSAYHLTSGKTVVFGMPDTIIQPKEVFLTAIQAAQPSDDAVLCLFKTNHVQKFGMVRLNQQNIATEIVDKPQQTDLEMMWGCIIWRARFTEFLHEALNRREIYDFAQIMNEAIQAGMTFRGISFVEDNYFDLGTYEEIMELEKRYHEE